MNPRLTLRRLNWKWSLPGLVLVAVLAAFFNPPDPGVTSGEFEYVQRVVDGDTLMLGTGERIRLIGVNTPESKHPQKPVEAFGKEASAFTKRMVEGKLVRLEFDPLSSRRNDGKDRYSRTLAYVFLQSPICRTIANQAPHSALDRHFTICIAATALRLRGLVQHVLSPCRHSGDFSET